MTGLGWSVAATCVGLFFSTKLTHFAVGLVAATALMGVWLIVAPQVAIHASLLRLQDGLVAADGLELLEDGVSAAEERSLRERMRETTAMSTWIYSPSDAIGFAAQLLLPVAVTVLSAVLPH